MMKRMLSCFLFLFFGLNAFSQVRTIFLDAKDRITADSTLAAGFAVFGKLTGDSVYTFKKFDLDNVMLTTGSFKDDSLQVPHGKFVYYAWVPFENTDPGTGYGPNGKSRYIALTGKYLDGHREGRWASFYPDGKIKQLATYVRDVLQGPYQLFENNGKVTISGMYINGMKNGTWVLRGGKQEDEYVNDKLISSLSGKKLRDKQAARKNIN